MNILGIDHGTKRIGLAIARGGVKLAYPLKTIENDQFTLEKFKKIIAEEKVKKIILGLPRNLSAQDTKQTAIVREFGEQLAQLGIEMDWQDETSSTERAISKGATKADKDAWAAAFILQDYLDRSS